MWTDAIPLAAIGQMKVERASTIEWNETNQVWEVFFRVKSDVQFSHPSREACIAWEIETINGQFAIGAACPVPSPAPAMTPDEHNAFPKGRWS